MDPSGLAVGMGAGIAVGISIGLALARGERPPLTQRRKKLVIAGIAFTFLGLIALALVALLAY